MYILDLLEKQIHCVLWRAITIIVKPVKMMIKLRLSTSDKSIRVLIWTLKRGSRQIESCFFALEKQCRAF